MADYLDIDVGPLYVSQFVPAPDRVPLFSTLFYAYSLSSCLYLFALVRLLSLPQGRPTEAALRPYLNVTAHYLAGEPIMLTLRPTSSRPLPGQLSFTHVSPSTSAGGTARTRKRV